MNQGWMCPRCHQCYAPTVKKCKDCRPVAAAPAPIYWPDWTYRPWPWYPYWNGPWYGGTITLCGDNVASGGFVSVSSSSVVDSAANIPYTLMTTAGAGI